MFDMTTRKRRSRSNASGAGYFEFSESSRRRASIQSEENRASLTTFDLLWYVTPLLFALAWMLTLLAAIHWSFPIEALPQKERVILGGVLVGVPLLVALFDYVPRVAITLLNRKYPSKIYRVFRYLFLPELGVVAAAVAVFFALLHNKVPLKSVLDLFIEQLGVYRRLTYVSASVYSLTFFLLLKVFLLILYLSLVCQMYFEESDRREKEEEEAKSRQTARQKREALVQNLLNQIEDLSASIAGRSTYYEQHRNALGQAKVHISALLAASRKAVEEEVLQLSSPWFRVLEQAAQCIIPESQEIGKQLSALENRVRAELLAPWKEIGNLLEDILRQIDRQLAILSSAQKHEQSQLAQVTKVLTDVQQYPVQYNTVATLQASLASLSQGQQLFEAATTSALTRSYSYGFLDFYRETPNFEKVLARYDEAVARYQEVSSGSAKRVAAYTERLDEEMVGFLSTPNPLQAGFVGTRSLMWHELPAHVFAIGTTGRGKSMFLEMVFGPWFYAVARRVHSGWKPPLRMFIFDVDGEVLPICEGVGIPSSNRFFLNPYDARGEGDGFIGWAAGRDLISFRHISRFVKILFSEQHEGRRNQGTSDHFVKQARPIMECIMAHLQRCHGTEWDLHDAFTILFDYDRLVGILREAPAPFNHIYRGVFDREEHGQDTISTLWGQVGELREIAALWHARTRRGSLREWFGTSGIFTISQQGGDSEGLKRLNQAFTQLLSDIVVKELPEAEINTACIFDEMVRLWPIQGVPKLFTNGRKKGVICCGAFQNVREAEDKIGEGAIDSLIDQSDIVAMLGTNSRYTAEFNSKRCGDEEIDEYLIDVSFGSSDQSSTTKTTSESRGTTESTGETDQKGWSKASNWGSQWTSGSNGSSNSGSSGGQSSTSGSTSVTTTKGTQLTNGTSEAHGEQQGTNRSVTMRQQRRQKPRLEPTFWLDIPKTSRYTGMTGVIEVLDPATQQKRRRMVTISPELLDAVRPERTESLGFIAVAPQAADRLLQGGEVDL